MEHSAQSNFSEWVKFAIARFTQNVLKHVRFAKKDQGNLVQLLPRQWAGENWRAFWVEIIAIVL